MEVSGSAGEARGLAYEVKRTQKALLLAIADISKKLEVLAQSWKDEELEPVRASINSAAKTLKSQLELAGTVAKKLDEYADILDRALIGKMGAGVIYGAGGCGEKPDYGVSKDMVCWKDESGAEHTLSLTPEGLRQAYKNAGSEDERARIQGVSDLLGVRGTMDLNPDKSTGLQLGGPYGKMKKGFTGYEAHHMPPKGAIDADMDILPSILLPKAMHAQTDSYTGRMNAKSKNSFLPDSGSGGGPYKQQLKEKLDEGGFAEQVRNEVYEIKKKFGSSVDGALSQFFEYTFQFIMKYGLPGGK